MSRKSRRHLPLRVASGVSGGAFQAGLGERPSGQDVGGVIKPGHCSLPRFIVIRVMEARVIVPRASDSASWCPGVTAGGESLLRAPGSAPRRDTFWRRPREVFTAPPCFAVGQRPDHRSLKQYSQRFVASLWG